MCLAGCTIGVRFGVGPDADKPTVDFSASAAQLVDIIVALDERELLDRFIDKREPNFHLTDPLELNDAEE